MIRLQFAGHAQLGPSKPAGGGHAEALREKFTPESVDAATLPCHKLADAIRLTS